MDPEGQAIYLLTPFCASSLRRCNLQTCELCLSGPSSGVPRFPSSSSELRWWEEPEHQWVPSGVGGTQELQGLRYGEHSRRLRQQEVWGDTANRLDKSGCKSSLSHVGEAEGGWSTSSTITATD